MIIMLTEEVKEDFEVEDMRLHENNKDVFWEVVARSHLWSKKSSVKLKTKVRKKFNRK